MADYSRSPLEVLLASQQKGYVGVHIEQNVPVLDRDLNLLHDLVAATVRAVITRYVGDGTPAGADGFAVLALPGGQNGQDFRIGAGAGVPGTCLVGGLEVTIPAPITYQSQPGVPPLTTPGSTQPDPRTDLVYLDAALVEVDGEQDTDLKNLDDVGMQTSVRLRAGWTVRVAEGVPIPGAPAGHAFYPLARLRRPRGVATVDASMITDLRQRRLTVSDMEQRLALMERTLLLPAFGVAPVPQFVPRSGVINQAITVNGVNLDVGGVVVRFGDVVAEVVGSPTPGQLVVRVPGGLTPAGTAVVVKLSLTNAGGTTVSDDTFTVQPAPALGPPGTQFTPIAGTAGAQVTLHGFNLNAGTPQVQFATTTATVVGSPSNTSLVAQVPTGLVPVGNTSADVRITVTTPNGSVVSDDTFRAEQNVPAPVFGNPQFTPRSGVGGQNITINGQNLASAPVTVKFDTTTATIVGSPSATQIVAQVPSGMTGLPRVVKISVSTAGGTAVSTDNFTVNA